MMEHSTEQDEEKYRMLFENAPGAIFVADPDGRYTEVNEAACRMTGFSGSELLNMTLFELASPDSPPGDIDSFAELKKNGKLRSEIVIRRKDGSNLDVLVDAVALSGERFMAFCSDITKRKEAEKALQESEEKYRTLVESSFQGVVIAQNDPVRLSFVNQPMEVITGYSVDELLGNGPEQLVKLIHPDDRERFFGSFRDRVAGKVIPARKEYRIIHRNGDTHWVDVESSRIEYGGELATLTAFLDITEHKQAEEALKESENKYKLLVENQSDLIVKVDLEGRFLYVSPAYCKLFDKTEEDLLNKKFMPLVHEEDIEKTENAMKNLFKPPYTCYIEQRAKTKDGWKWLSWSDTAILNDKNEVIEIIGSGQDITQRKKAEELLTQNENRYRTLVETSTDGITLTDLSGKYIFCNTMHAKLLGYENSAEIIGEDGFAFVAPESLERAQISLQKLQKERYVQDEFIVLRKDGSRFPAEYSATMITDEKGNPESIMVLLRDITKRKLAEEAVQKSEEKFRYVLSNSVMTLYNFNLSTGTYDYLSPAVKDIYGYSPEEFISGGLKETIKRFHPDDLKKIENHLEKLLCYKVEDFTPTLEYRFKHPKLGYRWISDTRTIIFDENGNPKSLIGNAYDITDRKQAEEALHQYEHIVSSSTDMLALLDKRFNYLAVNEAYLAAFKLSPDQVIGKTVSEVFGEDFFNTVIKPNAVHCMEGNEINYQDWFDFPVYGRRWMDITYYPYKSEDNKIEGFVVNGRNITQRKRFEEERKIMENYLHQSQKLEAIGTLAGGVAHEINNPIQSIIGFADIIQDEVGEKGSKELTEEMREFTERIKKESMRIATIVQNLLSFARQEKESHGLVHIKDIVGVSITLLAAVFRRCQITVETNIPKDLPLIKCQSQQIEQVLINLLSNARDALNQKYEAWHEDKLILISAGSFEKDGTTWVRTTVEDHGTGIPKETIGRIFDPFFTSKERGKGQTTPTTPPGTGLGLSVSHGIIADHHGHLLVESVEGKYTRFHIDLRADDGGCLEERE